MDRIEKKQFVDSMQEAIKGVGSFVVAHYAGLTVAEITQLRVKMREGGGTVKVAKNRLMKRVFSESSVKSVCDLFSGQTLIAYGADPVIAPKVLSNFAKENENLVLLGGFMDETILDVAAVKSLASLPSLDELRAKLIALLNTPATRLAMVSKAPASQLARVISAYSTTSPKAEAA